MVLTLTVSCPGKILVNIGEKVSLGDALAEVQKGKTLTLNLAKILRVKPRRVLKFLRKRIGEEVKEGEVIAQKKKLLGQRLVTAPASAILEKLENETGILTLGTMEEKFIVTSPLVGKVKEIKDKEVILEFEAVEVGALAGVGPKVSDITLFGPVGEEIVDLMDLTVEIRGKAVLGRNWRREALSKAYGLGAAAILATEVDNQDLEKAAVGKKMSLGGEPRELKQTLMILDKIGFEKVVKYEGHRVIVEPEEKRLIII